MVISAILFLDSQCRKILSRDYRGEFVRCSHCENRLCGECDPGEVFRKSVESQEGRPVFYSPGLDATFLYVRQGSVYVVGVVRGNGNVPCVFVFLRRLCEIMEKYFGVFSEDSLKKNFTVAYEILDEVVDSGYIQTAEFGALEGCIFQRGSVFFPEKSVPAPPESGAGEVSWRGESVFHSSNEIYLDVIETVNAVLDEDGNVARSEISGKIVAKCRLSGMPTVVLGLNDRQMLVLGASDSGDQQEIELENVRFHRCVDVSVFETERSIRFVPPDGDFELLSYSFFKDAVQPVEIVCRSESYSGTRIQYSVRAQSRLPKNVSLRDVEIEIPVPEDADTPVFSKRGGSSVYVPERGVIVWRIPVLPPQKQFWLTAQIGLPRIRTEGTPARKTVTARFRVPYFATSGFRVRYLRVQEETGYKAKPWVRYLTQSGVYEAKIKETE
ncbi:MAG: AP-1 complex subunit mu-1 [Amphiamblys sp. WSBS2006]|nr:MAG: AP-1 complex subunit mu-1 [Amphiamblys sp. WSBS2006]